MTFLSSGTVLENTLFRAAGVEGEANAFKAAQLPIFDCRVERKKERELFFFPFEIDAHISKTSTSTASSPLLHLSLSPSLSLSINEQQRQPDPRLHQRRPHRPCLLRRRAPRALRLRRVRRGVGPCHLQEGAVRRAARAARDRARAGAGQRAALQAVHQLVLGSGPDAAREGRLPCRALRRRAGGRGLLRREVVRHGALVLAAAQEFITLLRF